MVVCLIAALLGCTVGTMIRRAVRGSWPLTEVCTALIFGALTWDLWPSALLLPHLFAASCGVALSAIDWRLHRLPDSLILPSYPVLLLLIAVAAPFAGGWVVVYGAALGAVAAFAVYLTFKAFSPSLGGGDVKASGLVGMLLGMLGPHTWLAGMAAGPCLAGVYALCLLATRRGRLSDPLPFGPFLFAGGLVGILISP
ncbi:prepilin peptidase [Nonomuraea sp. NPDC050556]|uniref:prepilin peptidase n=1 Tax=Nonomuraea sp. NPDC050556 TaxID=3364369 RepID=UPI0037AB776A